MSNDTKVEWVFEIDQDIYDSASLACKLWGTTIEELTAAFIRFSVDPQNLPMVEAFLTLPQESEARHAINRQIFQGVLKIALHERSCQQCRDGDT